MIASRRMQPWMLSPVHRFGFLNVSYVKLAKLSISSSKIKLEFSVRDPEYEKIMQEQGTVKVQRTAYSRKGGGVRSLWVDSVLKYLTFDMARDCRQMKKLYPVRSNPIH